MEALILFSHGSVLCGAGETLKWHAMRLNELGDFAVVEVGYLNYSEPTFAAAAARCHDAGATHITVVPYFLVPGKFVKVDLPAHIAAARARWPNLDFRVAPPIGFDEGLADALLELADAACASERWREDLERVSDYCEADPQCPLYGSPRCPRVPAITGGFGPVEAAP